MIKIQGIPVAREQISEPVKVQDPTVVLRTLKGLEVQKVTVENGHHRIVFNLETDTVEEITFPGHPNGTLADLINLVNRVSTEAAASLNINNKLAGTFTF